MDEKWLKEYYEGLGYSEDRIGQIIANGKAIEKEKEKTSRRLKKW